MISTELETVARLDDPAGWAPAAASLLADLGFTLINSDHPMAPGGAHLLVALRDQPTLRHFDPEAFTYWAPTEPHARQVVVDRPTLGLRQALPSPQTVLWGHLHVVDRLGVENRFLTFGGTLRVAATGPALIVLDVSSRAPIVRWGGHSQDTDPLATEVGAFFGRLIVPVDYQPGIEHRLEVEDPETLYAAFLAWSDARLDRIAATTGERGPVATWIDREEQRLRSSTPATLVRGRELLSLLQLAG